MIRQLISAREYTKPVRFFASVDTRKRLKPASTEDGYKPFCSVDRPLCSIIAAIHINGMINYFTSNTPVCCFKNVKNFFKIHVL